MKEESRQDLEKYTPKARALLDDVRAAVRKKKEEALKQPLFIPVWGPSEETDDLHKKREDIVAALCDAGHAAIMSEDLYMGELSISEEERVHAEKAHCIVLILSPGGPTGEMHDHAAIPRIRQKMLVFVPEEAKESYSKDLIAKIKKEGTVVSFVNKDVEDCHLLEKTLSHVVRVQQEVFCSSMYGR